MGIGGKTGEIGGNVGNVGLNTIIGLTWLNLG